MDFLAKYYEVKSFGERLSNELFSDLYDQLEDDVKSLNGYIVSSPGAADRLYSRYYAEPLQIDRQGKTVERYMKYSTVNRFLITYPFSGNETLFTLKPTFKGYSSHELIQVYSIDKRVGFVLDVKQLDVNTANQEIDYYYERAFANLESINAEAQMFNERLKSFIQSSLDKNVQAVQKEKDFLSQLNKTK